MNQPRFNTDEELLQLESVVLRVQEKTLSLRKGAEFLKDSTGKTISHEGLRKIVNRRREGS